MLKLALVLALLACLGLVLSRPPIGSSQPKGTEPASATAHGVVDRTTLP